jgi:hypothetical protein
MQDLEKNTGKWQCESEQEARNYYIIGSFVSLTFRLTFLDYQIKVCCFFCPPTEGVWLCCLLVLTSANREY